MAPVTQGNTGVSKSKRNNAKKRKNKKLGVGQMKLLAAISNSLPKLHDPSALPTEDDDSSASLKKYDAAGNIASMDWKKVTNYTLNQSARVRGSRIHRFYHDADLQTRAIPQMRTFQFLYHSDLPKEAKMLTLILSTDPYVTVDRSHINCRYHLLRVLLKKLHGEKLLKWEYWFLRACIEHRYVSGNSMLNSFVEYLEKCPVHQRPTRLTKPQREKWRSLEVAVSIAWGNKTYQVSGGIDMALLRAGMDLLFPKIYYQEDLEKDFDAEDSWLPVQIYRAQVGQSGIPLGPEARDDEVDYVIRDFVSEGMMDGGRGVKIDSRGMTDLVGQLGAKPERDELEGEDDVNSETVLDNLSTLILNMENTSLILKAAYPTVFNFHTKVDAEAPSTQWTEQDGVELFESRAPRLIGEIELERNNNVSENLMHVTDNVRQAKLQAELEMGCFGDELEAVEKEMGDPVAGEDEARPGKMKPPQSLVFNIPIRGKNN